MDFSLGYAAMLKSLLTPDTIQVVQKISDWRAAISLACQPLIDNGSVRPSYVEAIFRAHESMGPYYVLGPGIALPHARPEDGVNRLSLALLVVREGVSFQAKEHDPIYLLVVLAAEDSRSHIEAIAKLAALFDNSEEMSTLKTASSKKEVLQVIERY